MKTEDFERLKKLCDENGFELVTESPKNNDKFFVVKKKDEWEGVEFFEVAGRVYKIDKQEDLYFKDTYGRTFYMNLCKPSTEQAYIEQLKKEAFERFGEIKEGDRFDRTNIDYKWGSNVAMEKSPFGNFFWKYDQSSDTLFIGRYGIYSKGKWAERVKKRPITIEWEQCDYKYITFSYSGSMNLIPRMKELAEVLEKYLNNEIE